MTDNLLRAFRDMVTVTVPTSGAWILRTRAGNVRMFGLTEQRAKEYERNGWGIAEPENGTVVRITA